LTAQGVGHMVPQWKPEVGYYIFEKFVKGLPFFDDSIATQTLASE